MARVTLYVPAELKAKARSELPDLSLSALFTEALANRLKLARQTAATTPEAGQ